MPTGYTSDIYSGKDINLKKFMLKCARAFGACVDIRDESLDIEIPIFKPSNFYKQQIENVKLELEYYENISDEDLEAIIISEYNNKLKSKEDEKIQKTKLKEKYNLLINAVENWNPPTEDLILN